MNRRNFIHLAGISAGAMMLPGIPVMGRSVPAEALLDVAMDVAIKNGYPMQL